MSTIVASNLQASGGGGTAATLASINGGPLAGSRNRIINGDMRIDQRNGGASVTVNSSALTYAVDRWAGFGMATAGVFTLNCSTTAPSNFTNSLAAVCTTADGTIAAGDRYCIDHRTEGFNVADFGFGSAAARTITLSFWVQSSLTGTYCVALINSAVDRSYVAEYTINAADTWEYKTITVAGNTSGTWLSDNGIGIAVRFTLATGTTFQTTANAWAAGNFNATANQVNWMSSSSSRTFRITGVQLEPGSVATPFERRSYGQELALCQRYFETSYPAGVAVGGASDASGSLMNVAINGTDYYSYGSFRFSVKKRSSPTVTFYNPITGTTGQFRGISDSSNGATTTIGFANDSGVGRVGCASANMTGSFVYAFHYTASAEL
jgi:hypothetical protein